MKKTLVLVALALVACGTSALSAQEILTNGKLNIVDPGGTQQLGGTPQSWIVAATRGGVGPYDDAVASEGFADIDGGGSGLFFKAFTGSPPWDPTLGDVDVDFYQDNPGVPNKLYRLCAFFGAEANYSGLNTPGEQTFLGLDFLDGLGNVIGSTSLGLEGAGLGGSDPGLNYEKFTVVAASPAGTVSVRARATMNDGAFFMDPGQALVADCFSLICVPEPSTALLGCLALVGLVARRRSV